MTITTSGTLITYNDSTTQGTAFLGDSAQIFTSSGTFTIPTGITKVKVTVIGGGGGGGGCASSTCDASAGGGGAGAGSAIKYLTGLTSGNTIAVTIGSGGSGGVGNGGAGSAGGTSSISSGSQSITTVSGSGGGGGPGGTAGSYGDGSQITPGSATNGDLNMVGSQGYQRGGFSLLGNGGNYPSTVGNGNAGVYGGGGSGANRAILATGSANGGAGGTGVVIFEY